MNISYYIDIRERASLVGDRGLEARVPGFKYCQLPRDFYLCNIGATLY